jgi:mercuric ion transport protein
MLCGGKPDTAQANKTDIARATPSVRAPGEGGAVLLAIGGLAAAFGAASCCALPVLLASLGLGSAGLGSLALLAGPHRLGLLTAAIVCLAAGVLVLVRHRRTAAACAPGVSCGRPEATALMTGILSLGAVLIVLGFIFA